MLYKNKTYTSTWIAVDTQKWLVSSFDKQWKDKQKNSPQFVRQLVIMFWFSKLVVLLLFASFIAFHLFVTQIVR